MDYKMSTILEASVRDNFFKLGYCNQNAFGQKQKGLSLSASGRDTYGFYAFLV